MIMDLRPLDRLGSIKIKLGVLVAASVLVAAGVTVGAGRLGWSPLITVPLAVLVALAVTQLLAHGMTAPLRQMTSITASMAAGDYGRRAQVTARDEVGELGRAFNTMAEELEHVDQQRRDLIANVSHELRTPITALQAVLENLVDGIDPAEPATLRTALAQTERLGRLVTDLLDLSRIDAGQVVLHREAVLCRALLHDAVSEAAVGRTDLEFAVIVDPIDLDAYADRDRLRQVLANLLDNAIRHSPAQAQITLQAAAGADAGVVIDVIDQGPGIPADQRELVFERFRQGHRDQSGSAAGAQSGSDGGTGLGLAIARWVVHRHDGTIRVVDSPSGCDVRVALPGPATHLPEGRTP